MADVELVIKIPEEKYLYAKELVSSGKEKNPVVLAIGNGTLLPKGHGILIDADELKLQIADLSGDILNPCYGVTYSDIKNAPTIIGADVEDK